MDVRVIYDNPASGVWNMAMDEALLETVCTAGETGWLRFYRWDQPTLSLGYFQRHSDRQQHPPSSRCPIIRRSTGGGAIIHADELTYSLCIPATSHLDQWSKTLYLALHETFIEELEARGIRARICGPTANDSADKEPFLCFLRRADADILLGEHKIGGSAQRRRQHGLLQHGSILLRSTSASPELAGIEDISGICIDPWELAQRWAQRVSRRLQWRLTRTDLDEQIIQHARQWSQKRFGQGNWTYKR
jgi:lipoyl(octanoyl) transferase